MEDKNCCCNNDQKDENSGIETACMDIKNCNDDMDEYDSCECGFSNSEYDIFPSNPMLAQSYVPIQNMGKTFTPCCGLKKGTIFQSMM